MITIKETILAKPLPDIYSRVLMLQSTRRLKPLEEFLMSNIVIHEQRIGRRIIKHTYSPIKKNKNFYVMPYYLKAGLLKYLEEFNYEYTFSKHTWPVLAKYKYNFNTEIWESKKEFINKAARLITKNHGVTISLNTGEGKTLIMARLIQLLGLSRVVVFATNKLLQKQLHDDLEQHLGIDFKYIGGHAEDNQLYKVALLGGPAAERVICTSASAIKITEQNPSFWNNYDLAIFDECHAYCANKTKLIMLNCITKYKLALSASVDHNWNWPLIIHCCGDLLDGNKIIKSKQLKGKVQIIKYHGPAEYTRKITNKFGDTQVCKMVELFSTDPYRCQLIMSKLGELIPNHDGIIIMAFSNCMLETLRDVYFASQFPDVVCGTINEKTDEEEKKFAKEKAQVIFITYMSGAKALNIPRVTAMIFASSFVSNGIQISGRALRKNYKPEKVREFIDIVDQDAANFSKQLSKRLETWRERQFEMTVTDYYPDRSDQEI